MISYVLLYPIVQEMIMKQAKADPCHEGGRGVMNDIVTYNNILNIHVSDIDHL